MIKGEKGLMTSQRFYEQWRKGMISTKADGYQYFYGRQVTIKPDDDFKKELIEKGIYVPLKTRYCLKCDVKFESVNYNRICPECSDKNKSVVNSGETFFENDGM